MPVAWRRCIPPPLTALIDALANVRDIKRMTFDFRVMLDRRIQRTIGARLRHSPAVVLLGPRQVGKTTLARALAGSRPRAAYLDLEDPADQRRLHDPAAFLRAR